MRTYREDTTKPVHPAGVIIRRRVQLLDLFLLAGWYHAISFAANAAGVEPEDGAPRLADVLDQVFPRAGTDRREGRADGHGPGELPMSGPGQSVAVGQPWDGR